MTHNRTVLFVASCLALAVTAFMFVIRGHVGDQIMADITVNGQAMTNAELGNISAWAFFGFAGSILIASPFLDIFGMKRTLLAACILQIIGLGAFISTDNYTFLWVSMFVAGLGNGLVEAVINPLVASDYPDRKTHMLNVLHAWWPGGLIIGGLAAVFINDQILHLHWRVQMGLIMVPALAYGILILNQTFPKTERATAGVSGGEMVKTVFHPAFILLMICMMMTASSELAPNQWIESVLKDLANSSGTLILVYGSGIMFVLRYFAGPIAHVLSPIGMMWASTGITFIGLYSMSHVTTGTQAYVAATVFYIGVCFMWPTMLGIAAERFPRGGAMTIGFLGFIGQFALGMVIFNIGAWKDELGSAIAFQRVSYLSGIAFFIFGAWWIKDYMSGGYKAINLVKEMGEKPAGTPAE